MEDQLSRPRLGLAHVLARALIRPASVGMIVFAALALLVSPAVALGVSLALLMLLGFYITRPAIWQEAARQRDREWRSLPPTWTLSDSRLREAVTAIEDGINAVKALLPSVPASVREQLRHIEGNLQGLESCAAELVRRASWLGGFTNVERRDHVRRELERTGELAAKAPADARSPYEAAIRAREEQLRAFEAVEAEREASLAKLARLAAIIESLPHRIATLSLVSADYVNDVRSNFDQALATLERDLQTPQAVIGHVLTDEASPLD